MFEINEHSVAIDNDFIGHLVDTESVEPDELGKILDIVFSALGLCAIIHPLVYEKEVPKENGKIMQLFKENVIHNVEFSDITGGDEGKERYYAYAVKYLYHELSGENFPVEHGDVFNFWKARSSLGEIHTVAMCIVCACGIFLSDDKDSKELAGLIKNKFAVEVSVYNRKEFFTKHQKEAKEPLQRKVIRALTHSKFS